MPGRYLLQTRGHLREGGPTEKYDGVRYWIDWPLGNENGVLALPREQFESGSLETLDGSCYFALNFSFGSWSILISDDNLVSWPWVDPAVMQHERQPRPLEDLSTAEELEADFEATKDNPVTQEIVKGAMQLRDRLVAAGVKNAGELSVFEVLAASLRARWHLRDEGVIPRFGDAGDHEKAAMERLADDLGHGPGNRGDGSASS